MTAPLRSKGRTKPKQQFSDEQLDQTTNPASQELNKTTGVARMSTLTSPNFKN